MRPAFADFSPTVPAAFAVGIGISFSVFLLPVGGVEKGPRPVSPAFRGATGRVAADLPVVRRRAPEVRKDVSAPPEIVVALRPPATNKGVQVHRVARTVVVPRAPSAPAPAPVRAAAPAAPETPVTKTELFGIRPKRKGKARGQARGHGPRPETTTPASLAPERGKARGRSNEDQDRLPPGRAKKAPSPSAPGLPPPPRGNGGGPGGKDNGNGNWGKGNGGGDRGKGNGGGDMGKSEKKK